MHGKWGVKKSQQVSHFEFYISAKFVQGYPCIKRFVNALALENKSWLSQK